LLAILVPRAAPKTMDEPLYRWRLADNAEPSTARQALPVGRQRYNNLRLAVPDIITPDFVPPGEETHGKTARALVDDRAGSIVRLAPEHLLGILRGVCAAVEAAHRQGLIHRDLKPENIFLVEGETDWAKVLDFGVAKFLPSATSQSTVDTSPGVLVGTLQYMSPEQLRGQEVQPGWDLWALAVAAYEALAGELPFPAATAAEWHGAVLAGRFTPPGQASARGARPMAAVLRASVCRGPGESPGLGAVALFRIGPRAGETVTGGAGLMEKHHTMASMLRACLER
jgi:hypothetical protein